MVIEVDQSMLSVFLIVILCCVSMVVAIAEKEEVIENAVSLEFAVCEVDQLYCLYLSGLPFLHY